MTLSTTTLSMTKLCHYAEWHDAECRVLFVAMLNVTMQSAVEPRAALETAPAPAALAGSFLKEPLFKETAF